VVAHAFAREGARVFLAGRTLAKVEAVAKEITEAGGVAEAAQVDALDEQAVGKHIGRVAETTARIAVGVAFIRRQRKLADPLQEQKPEAARSRIDGTTEGWRRATR
jgi:NADP-dependent 3-hydroxy acid dehydrogenase YdfG